MKEKIKEILDTPLIQLIGMLGSFWWFGMCCGLYFYSNNYGYLIPIVTFGIFTMIFAKGIDDAMREHYKKYPKKLHLKEA